MGGGVGISAHGTVRVVTDRTRLAMPEVRIGNVPDVGGTHLLSRAPGELGTHAALTAARLTGADAIACGPADVLVPATRLPDLVAALRDSGDPATGCATPAGPGRPRPSKPGHRLRSCTRWRRCAPRWSTATALRAGTRRRWRR